MSRVSDFLNSAGGVVLVEMPPRQAGSDTDEYLSSVRHLLREIGFSRDTQMITAQFGDTECAIGLYQSPEAINDCVVLTCSGDAVARMHGTDCVMSQVLARDCGTKHRSPLPYCERFSAGGAFRTIEAAL